MEALRTALSDRYTLVAELGRGGTAVVFRAIDQRHDRAVALKVLTPELSAAVGPERFRREIELTARLQHPHILPLHDSGEAGGRLYYVMPLIDGASLRERLERDGPLSVEAVLAIAAEVGDALAYAHTQGVVHRDLKPENILFSQGHAVLADFGVAHFSHGANDRLTGTGMTLGTPAYMSPEQAVGEATLDGRSDQYAFACVLFELLTGGPPYAGASGAAIVTQHLTAAIPNVATRRRDVSESIAGALRRALAKSPDERFGGMREFIEALRAAPPAREPEQRSIAVLPFANLSPDPDTDYFADGLTEEIITDLSRLRALHVISRNSAMTYKGTAKDTRTIARELNVRYLLEGSVRRAGPALRVTAQLIEAAQDRTLWAERFPGVLEDVFEIQERIARRIAEALQVQLSTPEDERLGRHGIKSFRVFEQYVRMRKATVELGVGDLASAETAIAELLRTEPDSPPLLALRGYVQSLLINFGAWEYTRIPEALVLLDRALGLDPDDPVALVGKASMVLRQDPLDLALVLRLFRRGADTARNADSCMWLGYLLPQVGRTDLGIRFANLGMAIDPAGGYMEAASALSRWFRDHDDAALASVTAFARRIPRPSVNRIAPVPLAAAQGTFDVALALAREDADEEGFLGTLCRLFVASIEGDREVARALAFSSAVAEARRADEQCGWWSAQCLAHVGLLDEAIACLRQAADRGFLNAHFAGTVDQMLAPLHAHPGFAPLLADMERRSKDIIARAGFDT